MNNLGRARILFNTEEVEEPKEQDANPACRKSAQNECLQTVNSEGEEGPGTTMV